MMTTIPTIDAIQKLNGRNFATLTSEELFVFAFYRDQGRKFYVGVSIISDADQLMLAQASRQQAEEIMRRANSHVLVGIDNGAYAAWSARARYDETQKLVTNELGSFVKNGMQVGRKSFPHR